MQWLTSIGRVRPELRATEYWQQGRSREIAWTKHLWPLLWRTSRYKLLSTTYTEAAIFLSRCIWILGRKWGHRAVRKERNKPRFFDKTLRSVHTRGHESRECSSYSLLRATCLFSCGNKPKFVPATCCKKFSGFEFVHGAERGSEKMTFITIFRVTSYVLFYLICARYNKNKQISASGAQARRGCMPASCPLVLECRPLRSLNFKAFQVRGGGVLPYIRYIGMCRPKGYGFWPVLVWKRV